MMGTSTRLLVLIGVMVIASGLIVEPTRAQPKLPDQSRQETLIKTTLLTFNDANVTGNYSVLHAKSAKPFRDQFTPARLKETFKEFAEKHIDFDIIAAKTPLLTQEPKLDEDGRLTLQGYFDTAPSHVYYDLRYILSEGEWKPIKINVQVKAPDKKMIRRDVRTGSFPGELRPVSSVSHGSESPFEVRDTASATSNGANQPREVMQ